MNINELIAYGREHNCSDLHLTAELNPVFRKQGRLVFSDFVLNGEEIEQLIKSLLSESRLAVLEAGQDVDFAFTTTDGKRQRVNVYRQQGQLCCAIRLLNDDIPTLAELEMPPILQSLADNPRGLILVTGPTGSGKSTTLAAMIDYINSSRNCHIITIEDPIEYIHSHKNSMIHQREVGADVTDFASALRSSLREDPDVILVGEMRDYETISAAVTAAETGHLVFSTLHTTGAANTIDRIVDVFPAAGQQQIRTQLAGVLKGCITQQLIPRAFGDGRVAALEILTGTDGVLNLIRENKCHQLVSMMQTGTREGMQTFECHLAKLARNGVISVEAALEASDDKNSFQQYYNGRL